MKIKELLDVECGDGSRKLRSFDISGDYAADIGEAVAKEHADECDSNTCDINAAHAAGFNLAAAHLLSGATECALLDAVERAHRFNGTAEPLVNGWPADFDEWVAHFKERAQRCAACGSCVYQDPRPSPGTRDSCGNCARPVVWRGANVDDDNDNDNEGDDE